MPDLTLSEATTMRDRLLRKLVSRRADIVTLHRYYDGDHDLPPVPDKCSQDLKDLRASSVLNLCPLVVNAVDERLEVQGFQFGQTAEGSDLPSVWEQVWQPNQLDAVSGLVMQEALIARRSFVLVWPSDAGVEVYPEVPTEVLVDYVPGRRHRRAAIKSFDDDGIHDVTLWTADQVWHWRSTNRTTGATALPISGGSLRLDEAGTGENPVGKVPVVEFLSLPDLRGVPHSELDRGVLRIQASLTKTRFDRLTLQEFHAFPQRWATGFEVETDEHGNPVQPIKIGPNVLSVAEDADTKFGQWDAANMGPLLDATSADIHAMAAITKTPVHYLAAEFSNVSADAIRAAEAGLIMKVKGHQRTFGEAWEEVIRLALGVLDDPRAGDTSSFVEWTDPETRTVAELADATMKLAPFLPQDETWARLGYSPQKRKAFAVDMASQSLQNRLAVLNNAQPPPVQPDA